MMINLLKSIKSYYHECFVDGAIDWDSMSEAERRRVVSSRYEQCRYPQGKPTIDDIVWEVLDKL